MFFRDMKVLLSGENYKKLLSMITLLSLKCLCLEINEIETLAR